MRSPLRSDLPVDRSSSSRARRTSPSSSPYLNLLPDKECITAVDSGSWLAMASKRGSLGSVEAILNACPTREDAVRRARIDAGARGGDEDEERTEERTEEMGAVRRKAHPHLISENMKVNRRRKGEEQDRIIRHYREKLNIEHLEWVWLAAYLESAGRRSRQSMTLGPRNSAESRRIRSVPALVRGGCSGAKLVLGYLSSSLQSADPRRWILQGQVPLPTQVQ